MSRRNQLVLATTVAGAVAASGAAIATRKSVRAQQRRPDSEAEFLARPLPVDRERTVRTDDGLDLYVAEVGAPDAPLTVVFAHGWTCTADVWAYQRRDLAADDRRLVFYDQRGHGRSGRPDSANTDIDMLGSDLRRVIESVRAPGPVVVIGHSMGGMAVMALADQHPELFSVRGPIVGVGLLSTSPGDLASVTLGLPGVAARAGRVVLPRTYRVLERFGDRVEALRAHSDVGWLVTKRVSFAGDVPPSYVELMERMMSRTPLATFAGFGSAVLSHDKHAALAALRSIPTLILVGDDDLLTPLDHSNQIAAAVRSAELVVLPHCGHMVMLERHELTTARLRALLRRAAAAAASAA